MAPFTPFFCESLYQNLRRALPEDAPTSVHWCDFPSAAAEQVGHSALSQYLHKSPPQILLALQSLCKALRQPLHKQEEPRLWEPGLGWPERIETGLCIVTYCGRVCWLHLYR